MSPADSPAVEFLPTGSKRGLQLDRVVLLGRTLDEYQRYFALNLPDWKGKRVLDVAGGVSSFTAEAATLGLETISADPIYALAAEEIAPRSTNDVAHVLEAVRGLPTYKWDFYKSPENMAVLRKRASDLFLQDYQVTPGRYIPASLPRLPFPSARFDLTLVSYFLFAYQEQLDYHFHLNAILELLRVTRGEVRIYPTVTFEGVQSHYIPRLMIELASREIEVEFVETDFEFLKNSNRFMRLRKIETQN